KYRAVCRLSLTTLNCQRSSIFLQRIMETGKVISSWTSLWRSKTDDLLHKRIHLGVRVSSLDHKD
ncbi:hypothetical protein MKX03_008574, partial [Papaver bracteatum]